MAREHWKPIKGYVGWYEVSNLGRIRSVDRRVMVPNRWGGVSKTKRRGQLRKLSVDRDGYWRVGLYKQGFQRFLLVHRLVAKTFLANPKRLPEVDHADSDRLNAKVDNLTWVTELGNVRLTVSRGRTCRGESSPNTKLTIQKVQRIRACFALGASKVSLAKMFGVSDVAIGAVVTRRTWAHVV